MTDAPAPAASAGLVADADDDLPPPDPERIVELLAGALARLHDLGAADGVPTVSAPALVERARAAVADGWGPDPVGPYAHMAADRLLGVLESGLDSVDAPLVLTHGRPTVERLRVRSGAGALVGWEHAALADPYRDLAIAAQDLASSIGPMLVPLLFERYRAARPAAGDAAPRRLDWYVLAGQFGS